MSAIEQARLQQDAQIATAQLNQQGFLNELHKLDTLMGIAVAADSIPSELSYSVRDSALRAILNTLTPPLQKEKTPDNVVEFPVQSDDE